jgi:tripartite-type tricarboxylate transporter receptor subunit TctC
MPCAPTKPVASRPLRSAAVTYSVALALAACLSIASASAAAAEDFYKDKTIDFIVGGNAGGGYDVYARAIARHLPRHIPGAPTIVVKNMQGGGSAKAASFLVLQGAKDGTMIGAVFPGAIMEPLLGTRAGKFPYDPRQFQYLGTANNATRICASWHGSKTSTFDDALKRTTIMGASQAGGSTRDYAYMLKHLTGAKFDVVAGYKGTVDMIIALERGEIEGLCGYDFSSLRTQRPDWIRDKKVNLLVQLGLEADPELTRMGVPEVWKYVKSAEDRKVIELIVTQQVLGRPYFAPPGVPADRLKLLRDGFAATFKDKAFLADAQKMRIDIEPLDGAKVQALVEKLYTSPKELIERAGRASAP